MIKIRHAQKLIGQTQKIVELMMNYARIITVVIKSVYLQQYGWRTTWSNRKTNKFIMKYTVNDVTNSLNYKFCS